ncbi:MAG TPA: PAS domain S-box protein, partial [Acidobacteriota bacterium]|nr:PAS domain S-box protein [Acidobacteriota bacterium]
MERSPLHLKESEERYRVLVENSLQGLAIVQDGRFVLCNNSFSAMTGYSKDEIMSFPDSRQIVHPRDRDLVTERQRNRLAGMPMEGRSCHRIVRK